jgi:hypothetical protein
VLPAAVGRSEGRTSRIDFAGIALLTLGVGLLLVGLTERTYPDAAGALPGWWEWQTGGLIAASLLVAALFVALVAFMDRADAEYPAGIAVGFGLTALASEVLLGLSLSLRDALDRAEAATGGAVERRPPPAAVRLRRAVVGILWPRPAPTPRAG